MNYASFPVQAYNLMHYFLAFALVYVLLPRLLFRPATGSRMDGFVSMYLRMVCFVIVVGYALLVTKLFEALGFLGVVFVAFMIVRNRSAKHRNTVGATAMALFYDLVEARYLMMQWLRRAAPAARERLGHATRSLRPRWSATTLEVVILLAGIGVSIYLRGTDALTNPAPTMSDGYVTLAWIKYVNERILFHDGIYPQGLYFYTATMGKFAFINWLITLKYTGAMNAVLIVCSFYYTLRRWTGRRDVGLVAVLLYGVFGHTLLGNDWLRQAATNSQEFGFVFLMPTLYFLHRYLDKGDRVDYTTALAGLFVTGLTHPLAYVLCLVGCLSVLTAHLLLPGPFSKGRLMRALWGGLASGGVTLAPVALGFAFGHRFNASSVTYVGASVQTQSVPFPTLYWTDWLGMVAIVILIFASVREVARGLGKHIWLVGAIFGGVVFAAYYAGGPLTGDVVLISRSYDLWAMVDPFVVALAVHVVVALWNRERASRWATSGALSAALASAVPLGVVTPIIPYKMQWPEEVDAYLHIDSQFKYAGYMLVADNEEYALVLGSGYLQSISDFVSTFDPAKQPLTMYGQSHPDYGVAPNVFIYYPKKIFEVSKSNIIYSGEAPIYARRRQERVALQYWIDVYRKHHPLKVYYQDKNVIIYEITAAVQKKVTQYRG